MTPLAILLAYEASYRVWLPRTRRRDDRHARETWLCGPHGSMYVPTEIRVRQAEKWLAIETRERRRQQAMRAIPAVASPAPASRPPA